MNAHKIASVSDYPHGGKGLLSCDPQVLDQVFAELPDLGIRVDRPQRRTATSSHGRDIGQLAARIGQQLAALDGERNRLVKLLADMQAEAER